MKQKLHAFLCARRLPIAAALIGMALAIPAVPSGLQVDDFLQRLVLLGDADAQRYSGSAFGMFRFARGIPEPAREAVDSGFLPWWMNENVRLSFARPLTVLTHLLDYQLWPDNFVVQHIHSLFWYGAVVLAAALLYRRFMGVAVAAGLAALLYAVDDAHSMPAGWLANRNGLVAVFFGVLTIFMHARWREGKARGQSTKASVVAPFLLLLSLLSAEGGIATCAYLFAYAVCLDSGSLRARLYSLAPYAGVVVAWRLGYNAFHFGAWGSEFYIDPLQSPMRFITACFSRAPVLFFAQWGLPIVEAYEFLPAVLHTGLWIIAALFATWVLATLIPLLAHDKTARFWAAGAALSFVPICATFPMDRLLLFTGIGSMGLMAQFITRVFAAGPGELYGVPRGRHVKVLAVTLVIIHAVLTPILFPLRTYTFAAVGHAMAQCIEEAPMPEGIENKTLIIANAPNIFFSSYFCMVKRMAGKPCPKRIRSLAPNHIIPVPITMERIDECTIAVEPEGGYRWYLVRDSEHPMKVGEQVKLTGVTVTVKSLADQGWPRRVEYRFTTPLEDPSLVWVEVNSTNQYVPFTPPPVGGSIVFNEKWRRPDWLK